MSELVKENPWVWVVVQDPGGNEEFLGQHDDRTDELFIPAFLEKEEAASCLDLLAKDSEKKYEIQAIRYEDLAARAGENGFMIFILNGSGHLLEKLRR